MMRDRRWREWNVIWNVNDSKGRCFLSLHEQEELTFGFIYVRKVN